MQRPRAPHRTSAFRRQAAVYRLLLLCLPRQTRAEFGDDMVAIFCHHLHAARGSFGSWAAVWVGALADVVRHAPKLPRRFLGSPAIPRFWRQDLTMSERLRNVFSDLGRDFGYAARLLRRDWTFTLTATVILGLAIGANTAIFSFVDTYLLRPLPFPEPERLALVTRVWESGETSPAQDGVIWEAVRDAELDTFDAAVYSAWNSSVNLATGASAVNVPQQRVGAGYFRTLGVPPALGREFTPAEDVPDGPAVTILGHALWQTLFEGDPGAIGQSVLLRGEPYTVVGVMPPDFRSSAQADLWVPLRPSTQGEGGGTNYRVLLRLAGGVPREQADANLQAIGQSVFDAGYRGGQFERLSLTALQSGETQQLQESLRLLTVSVAVVLLVACVNVSGLLLVRGSRRGREIATRLAIGGGRAAMVRQMLVESVLLAAIGGVVGVAVGRLMLTGLESLGSGVLASWRPVSLDGRVLAATAGISLATALIFGLAPAFASTRVSIHDALRAGGGRGVAGGANLGRRAVVVAEVALSVVLLVMAGLLMRTFLHLRGLEPGFDTSGIVSVSVSLQDARYDTREEVETLFTEGLSRVRELPGVRSATAALGMPYQRLLNMGFQPLDFELPEDMNQITNLVYVSDDYFETLGIPVVEGRGISAADANDSEPVVVINRAFQRRYLPELSPIGRGIATASAERRIVGMVGNTKQAGSWGAVAPVADVPAVFVPVAQVGDFFLQTVHQWFTPAWILRVEGDATARVPEIHAALGGVDPLLPLASTRLASDLQASSVYDERFVAILVGSLAAASILLSALGIYGLVASTVAEQKREIGIRLALGAGAGHAVSVAAVPSIRLAMIGAILGVLGSIVAGRALQALLWGVQPADPWTYAGVAVTLVVAAGIASLVPASRAARVHPATSLQAE